MSGYENVMGGKLRLKGKALDVKAGELKKKKKKKQKLFDQISGQNGKDLLAGDSTGMLKEEEDMKKQEDDDADQLATEGGGGSTGGAGSASVSTYYDAHLTPAERRYMEQKEQIDVHRLAKIANKSHRDRIQDFNQYLANMSEHYDIPKVGPG